MQCNIRRFHTNCEVGAQHSFAAGTRNDVLFPVILQSFMQIYLPYTSVDRQHIEMRILDE